MSKKLRDAIERDNQLEEQGMHADDRKTCWTHQCWAEDCEDQHRRPTAGQLLAQARELDRIRAQRS